MLGGGSRTENLARLARELGLLSQEQCESAIQDIRRDRLEGRSRSVAGILLDRGYLTREQFQTLVLEETRRKTGAKPEEPAKEIPRAIPPSAPPAGPPAPDVDIEKEEAAEKEAALQEQIAEAQRLLAAGKLDEAVPLIQSLGRPGDLALRKTVEEMNRRLAELTSRETELDEAEQSLRDGKLDEAQRTCYRVLRKWLNNTRALDIVRRIDGARQDKTRSEKPAVIAFHRQPMSPEVLRWIIRGAVIGAFLVLAALVVFMLIPNARAERIKERSAAAEKLFQDGDAEAAFDAYEAIERDYPHSAAAEQAARRRSDLSPYINAAAQASRKADDASKRSEFEEAAGLYEKVAAKFPRSRRAKEAREAVPMVRRLACNDMEPNAAKAAAARRWDEAAAICEKMLSLDPAYPGAKEALNAAKANIGKARQLAEQAEAAEKAGDLIKARDIFRSAADVMPRYASASEGLNRVLKQIPAPPGMTLILPGEFTMGADDGKPGERPARKARTDGCYMDTTEVTNDDYAKFVQATGHKPPPHWAGTKPSPEIGRLPVVCVSWNDAAAYAAWAGKRLPTEIEWERAARWTDGRRHPWGDSLAGTEANLARGAVPVGQTPADRTEEGCLDMAGNVCEWTATAEGPAAPAGSEDTLPEEESRMGYKIARGASWAGFEPERSDRVVPARVADKTSNPVRVVLVDNPSAWGIEVHGFSEVEFFFRGMANDLATVEIRKWVPEARRDLGRNFFFRPGDAIAGEYDGRYGTGLDERRVHMRLDTGCKLVEVLNADDLLRVRIIYEDREGKRREMERSRRAEAEPARKSNADADKAAMVFDKVVRELSQRSLDEAVRCSNRIAAPAAARCINCGFRCAKDL